MNTTTRLLLAAGASLLTTAAHAAVTVNLYESGGHVVADYSGSLDTAGSTVHGTGTLGGAPPNGLIWMESNNGQIILCGQSGGSGSVNHYTLTAMPTFGTGAMIPFSFTTFLAPHVYSTTGTLTFGIMAGSAELSLQNDYISGSAFSGSTTYESASFADLGVATGSYVYTLAGSGDSVTINAIPEPATYGLAGAGTLLLLSVRRRRRA